MKPLLPTLKERQRYIVYEIITAQPMLRDPTDEVLGALAKTLGAFGMADAGVLSISYDNRTQTGMLRVTHTEAPRVRAALAMATHLGKTPVLIRTRGISGMIDKAKRFLPVATRLTERQKARGLRAKATQP